MLKICDTCGSKIFVVETRATDDTIYRTRKCMPCGTVMTTKEVLITGAIPMSARQTREPRKRK